MVAFFPQLFDEASRVFADIVSTASTLTYGLSAVAPVPGHLVSAQSLASGSSLSIPTSYEEFSARVDGTRHPAVQAAYESLREQLRALAAIAAGALSSVQADCVPAAEPRTESPMDVPTGSSVRPATYDEFFMGLGADEHPLVASARKSIGAPPATALVSLPFQPIPFVPVVDTVNPAEALPSLDHRDDVHDVVRDWSLAVAAGQSRIVSLDMLNRWFRFVGAVRHLKEVAPFVDGLEFPVKSPVLLISSASLLLLCEGFNMFLRPHISSLFQRHALRMSGLTNAEALVRLRTHLSQCQCPAEYYIFAELATQRRMKKRIRLSVKGGVASSRASRRTPASRKRARQVAVPVSSGYVDDLPIPFLQDPDVPPDLFPEQYTTELRNSIIYEWQSFLEPVRWMRVTCAVCAQMHFRENSLVREALDEELELLQDHTLPDHLKPVEYDMDCYRHALLHPDGLIVQHARGLVRMCKSCSSSLKRRKMPKDALANKLYYAHDRLPPDVKKAFAVATLAEKMYIAGCRMTRITFLIENPEDTKGVLPRQRANRGHCAFIPQDSGAMARMLPPPPDDPSLGICVVFVGQGVPPTKENIATRLQPLLCSLSTVGVISKFLTSSNRAFVDSGIAFNADNLRAIGSGFPGGEDRGLPSNVQVVVLNSESATGVHRAMQGGYSNTDHSELIVPTGETLIQNVGYASESQSSKAATASKALALDWVLNKRPFVQVTDGNRLFSDRHTDALTLTHPHLDPHALGGFLHPDRTGPRHLSMQRQLKNMLLMKDAPFAADPSFAYVFFNAIQRTQTSIGATFRVAENQYGSFVDTLMENRGMLEALESKYRSNPDAKPTTSGERKLINAMNQLRVMCKDVVGSNASRTRMRSKVRAMLKSFGCPTLFVTLNPTDVLSLQLHVLCGGDPNQFGQMTDYQRTKQVVDHPAETAIWFDRIIKSFIKIILRHGSDSPGLFGTSEAYFGTVEAQGRGSLHCHMLLWCKGGLSPQDVRDKIQSNPEFRDRMFGWLECIIQCELPGMTEVLRTKVGEKLVNPMKYVDGRPALSVPPLIPDPETMSPEERELFEERFQSFVHDLACAFNWHRHHATCWKYLKPGQPQVDSNCRMRIDGSTQPLTEIDEETGSILLRRLHPWINNFNDVVLFLLQSNMDVKYIGSGQAAKALVYYITDYITKGTLPMHVGLAAVISAIKKTEAAMQVDAASDEDPIAASVQRRRFLIKCVNAMMGRVELSHQQVMSYLVGGGDFYASHQFASLYWGDMSKFHSGPVLDSEAEDVDDYAGGVDVTVNMRDNDVVPTSQLLDYRHRPNSHGFDDICAWEFAGLVEKSRIKLKTDCPPAKDYSSVMYQEVDDFADEGSNHSRRAKLRFLDPHPQAETHTVHLRGNMHVPILSGPKIPRQSSGDDARERFCRAMLILFKPWRERSDLLGDFPNWAAAYDAHKFPDHLLRTIRHIHVEHECKDARDRYSEARRAGLEGQLMTGALSSDIVLSKMDPALFELAIMHEAGDVSGLVFPEDDLSCEDDEVSQSSQVPYLGALPGSSVQSATILQRSGILLSDTAIQEHLISGRGGDAMALQSSFRVPELSRMRGFMEKLRKLRRPVVAAPSSAKVSVKRPRLDQVSKVAVGQLQEKHEPLVDVDMSDGSDNVIGDSSDSDTEAESDSGVPRSSLRRIIKMLKMKKNPEQKLVMKLFDDHHERGIYRREQLLMYVAGVGGTGKSHVIRGITTYLKMHDHSDWLLIAAPTGIAAVLVNGYTIHALTFLNVGGRGKDDYYAELSPERKKAVEEIWRRVRYLIIDEVSMISATQLTYISKRLKEARSSLPDGDRPFGGVNVIVTGDFGQLEPVGGRALFHTSLVNRLDETAGMTDRKQFALHGAYLWRLFDKVVELKQVVRQEADPEYGEMLGRIRLGCATICGPGGVMKGSDYDTVCQRTLDSIRVSKSQSLDRFQDAPIIVGDRVTRDALNARLVHTKAIRLGIKPVFLCARDKMSGSKEPLSGPLAKAAIRLPPGRVDIMGCIPYFPGMKVMITENLAMCHKAVNGQEGILRKVAVEQGVDGMLHATCAFIEVQGMGSVYPELPEDIIPVFPSRTTHKFWSDYAECWVSFTREQLPLMPAYVYTDYKAQGRSLDSVIVDLASTTKPQGRYVMLSRVKTLEGLAVLRPFSSECFTKPLSKYIRDELGRISELANKTYWEDRNEPINDEVEYEDDFAMEVDSERGAVGMDDGFEDDETLVDSETETLLFDAGHRDPDGESTNSDDTESEVWSDYEEDYMVLDEDVDEL
ncbi:unnamed protein product [Peniophora sp. CBMAI 1063]|nr:unnamed protein product [Peniophora sp. CBMAI 1063]